MKFDFTSLGKVKITMPGYIEEMMKMYEVTGTAKTPALNNLFERRESSPLLSEQGKQVFHSRVAKCLFLSKRVRPDILVTCIFLASAVTQATEDDQWKLDRLLKYINGTRDLGLVLEASKMLVVDAHVDASHGVHGDFKGHTGSCISIGKGAIYAKSNKQKLNSRSSTESELIGLSDSMPQIVWTREFLLEQGYNIGPAVVHQDNMSTMALVEKGRATAEHTRHINLRYFFVKDRVDSGDIQIKYTPTGEMIADILTKPLQGELFRRLRKELLNWEA
jgi:hypothetical protein